MPHIEVSHFVENGGSGKEGFVDPDKKNPVKIYFRTYGKGDEKVVFIMGFGAGHGGWNPQVIDFAGTLSPNEIDENDEVGGVEEFSHHEKIDVSNALDLESSDKSKYNDSYTCLVFDNRGIGKSSMPKDKSQYTTQIMAMDALALINHLGWKKVHVVGHSMGGMIGVKLSSMVPDRVQSLAIISSSCGGYHALPKITRKSLSLAYRLLTAKTPEHRAKADLDAHYSKAHLEEVVEGKSRREILFQRYLGFLSHGDPQPRHGIDGHFHACVTHGFTRQDSETIGSGKFLVSVIHGRHDVIAHMSAGERLTRKIQAAARFVRLPGGHMINMERPALVNAAIKELLDATREGVEAMEWIKESHLWKKGDEDGELEERKEKSEDSYWVVSHVAHQASALPGWIIDYLLSLFIILVFWTLLLSMYFSNTMKRAQDGVRSYSFTYARVERVGRIKSIECFEQLA